MNWNPFRKPTPLEQAAADLIGSQHALLSAQLSYELAAAHVHMHQARIVRLRHDIQELSTEGQAPSTQNVED